MTIKAIETRYAGCRFRSRLEARWAVFFDTAGLEWQYEPEGFDLPSGWYLPDFRVKGMTASSSTGELMATWVEIKPGPYPEPGEVWVGHNKLLRNAERDILDPRWIDLAEAFREKEESVFILRDLWRPGQPPFRVQHLMHVNCISPSCEPCLSGNLSHVVLDDRPGHWFATDDSLAGMRCRKAFEAATSARFEHGERS